MAENHKRSAVLAGATGAVGRHLLSALLADDSYETVHVLSRRPIAATERKLHVHEIDFDRLDEQANLFDVDDVFCCLGSTMKQAGSKEAFKRVDYEYVVRLAQLASEGGARRFIMISAVGADSRSMFFYSRVKGDAEKEVREIGPETIYFVRPSLLLGDREDHRLGESISQKIMPAFNPLMAGPMSKYKAVQTSDVAEQMLQLAKTGPAGHHIHHTT